MAEILKNIIANLESIAAPSLQENYDNSGLLVGNENDIITKAIICLDCIESVVDEAIEKQANLIIAHHPIIFSGLKKLNGKNYIERTIIKAIKNNIAIYACHTNLDNVYDGVNAIIAEKLNLEATKILVSKENTLQKLITYCPLNHAEAVRNALFEAGAGQIGNYSQCSFNSDGAGTFMPNDLAKSFVGTASNRHTEPETKIEVLIPTHLQSKIIQALIKNHPYETVAYDIINLANKNEYIGAGYLGQLKEPINTEVFLQNICKIFKTPVLKHTKILKNNISKVAFCGGSGSFLLAQAIAQGADVFITADFTYHKYFDAEEKILIIDIGHYEIEQYTIDLIYSFLNKKFVTFALQKTEITTNPVNYFINDSQ